MARPDIVLILTDEERAAPPYESEALREWRRTALPARTWFEDNGTVFDRHYCGATACVPSRPTLFTGQYPDVHGVTQTDGLGKFAEDSRMRWLRSTEVPTLGHWMRAAGYDTFYDGKWHVSHAELIDPDTGHPVASNTDDGDEIPEGVAAYRAANRLDPYGFDGWVGPEPHGPLRSNTGMKRDPHTARRVVEWLEDRYRRRAAGDPDAQRPFLCVASFVNPHDIVFFPAWLRASPLDDDPMPPPPTGPGPTDDEDLSTKPSSQREFRDAYYRAYTGDDLSRLAYEGAREDYRALYHRLHREVDGHIDAVRRTVTEHGGDAVLIHTSDHGDVLGAHGGLHQKWFNLYDETIRVPLRVVGPGVSAGRVVSGAPTSHVDLIPTVLALAGTSEAELAPHLADFTELHPLPGRDLTPVLRDAPGAAAELRDRTVYAMSRDNILDGDAPVVLAARLLGGEGAPMLAPAGVPDCFEAVVTRVADGDGGHGHLWKLVRSHDDPDLWPTADWHDSVLDDEWELYDLDADPAETTNLWDPTLPVARHLVAVLDTERKRVLPVRNEAWPHPRRVPS